MHIRVATTVWEALVSLSWISFVVITILVLLFLLVPYWGTGGSYPDALHLQVKVLEDGRLSGWGEINDSVLYLGLEDGEETMYITPITPGMRGAIREMVALDDEAEIERRSHDLTIGHLSANGLNEVKSMLSVKGKSFEHLEQTVL